MTQTRARRGELRRFADHLKAHPGKWAPIPTNTKYGGQLVTRVRNGRVPALPPDQFIARSLDGIAYAAYDPTTAQQQLQGGKRTWPTSPLTATLATNQN